MPAHPDPDRLRSLKTLPQLIAYLRDDLDWPVDQDAVEDDVTFQYAPEELGFDAATAVHIKEIKQLRPLDSRQPWGVFWVNFEKKRLPVVMLRRILGNLVLKKRAAASKASQRAWHLHDLLFISAYGEESDRAITFAHFSQPPDSPGDLPILKVLGWDDGDTVLHLVDAHRTLAEKLRWPPKTTGLDEWRNQWASAFTLRHREVITTTTELVEELARLADATRRRARTILARESERGPLRRLYAAFKAALIHDLTEDDFADVIAQTISYGLLIARFSRAAISAQNLVDMVPATNPFLRELLGTFLALAGRQSAFDFDELGIQDVVEVLNRSNADAVKADFGNRTRDEDPVIHFYEHFLAAYDRQKKIQRGVFYTPQPAVSYIVRGIHELLQKEFGIEDGLASTITWGEMIQRSRSSGRQSAQTSTQGDQSGLTSAATGKELKLPKIRVPKAGKAEGEEVELPPDEFFVLILDIATGTGTFLVETIEVIFQHLQAKWAKHGLQGMPILPAPKRSPRNSPLPSDGRGVRGEGGFSSLHHRTFTSYWNEYVPAALLPRLYGYELMMAPYTIAHMKLALKFSEINTRLGQTDYLFKFDGRAHIYLTNTLEPPSGFQEQEFAAFFPALAHEAAAVNTVKRTKRFTVVMGNPPYSISSANHGDWIQGLIADYKQGLNETNLNSLSDDYIKFIRITQHLAKVSGTAVVGLITNNSFLDGVTHRRLREVLLASSSVKIVNLHGSVMQRDEIPESCSDENVFDIQQGVAISILSPQTNQTGQNVSYVDLIGTRSDKYARLASSRLPEARDLRPRSPYFFLKPKGIDDDSEYLKGFPLNEAFAIYAGGIKFRKDNLLVKKHFTRASVEEMLRDVARLSDADLLAKYEFDETPDWKLKDKRQLFAKWKADDIVEVMYRALDFRFAFYPLDRANQIIVRGDSRVELMKNVLLQKNIGLQFNRQIVGDSVSHFLVSRVPTSQGTFYLGNKGQDYFAPLYIYDAGEDRRNLFSSNRARFNFTPEFLTAITAALQVKRDVQGFPVGLTPEDIFHYAYGVFHSPAYRSRYAEFLKIDFPRLPLTGNLELFRALARLGGELTALHLLEFEVGRVTPCAPSFASKERRARSDAPYQSLTEFIGDKNPIVEKVSFVVGRVPSRGDSEKPKAPAEGSGPTTGTVWLDKAQTTGFKGVREDVWNFHIGGYQVCEKWLKDRKGRTLSADDRAHYQKIIIALSETIRVMAEIDAVIAKHGGWPLK